MAYQTLMIVLLVLGFGFVIFWHELGHFLAAKWVGIKVEQFAVGFGQALVAWRKGIGFRVGTTQEERDQRIHQYLVQNKLIAEDELEPRVPDVLAAEKALGLGETEYRLNWIPLGGYVKMLGQDDLKPNAQDEDPRAFNRKSIPARMLVVSAGVVMNVILAAVGFMIVFTYGLRVPPPIIGDLMPDSPAQRAGLHPGDRLLSIDGTKQWDFQKIALNVALLEEGKAVPVLYERNGIEMRTELTPGHLKGETKDLLAMGIEPPRDLRASKELAAANDAELNELLTVGEMPLRTGDVITAINGNSVKVTDFVKLDQAIQNAGSKPIVLTIRHADGTSQSASIHAHFKETFSAGMFHLAGMVPRARIISIVPKSPARKFLVPNDVVVSVTRANGDSVTNPSVERLMQVLKAAAADQELLSMEVLRDEKLLKLNGIPTGFKIEGGGKGLGVSLGNDEMHAVVADVLKDTPAYAAAVPTGDSITAVNNVPVNSWFDLQKALAAIPADVPLKLHLKSARGDASALTMTMDPATAGALRAVRYMAYVSEELDDSTLDGPRKAQSLGQAAWWGLGETRDLILQFYLTLHRMVSGSVSPSNMMGPIGIFNAGRLFSIKGGDWLIWFLCMISANLAVVNFLPIPIVDGGLFTFLILEKIQGKPLSARAQAIAQYAGLAFLAGIFIFVTCHDISRMF